MPRWWVRLACSARGHRLTDELCLSPGAPRSERCRCGARLGRTWRGDGVLLRDADGTRTGEPLFPEAGR